MRKLLASISAASDKPLPNEALTDIFEAMWGGLEDKVDAILNEHRGEWGDRSAATIKPDLGRVEAAVEEILALVREIKQSATDGDRPGTASGAGHLMARRFERGRPLIEAAEHEQEMPEREVKELRALCSNAEVVGLDEIVERVGRLGKSIKELGALISLTFLVYEMPTAFQQLRELARGAVPKADQR